MFAHRRLREKPPSRRQRLSREHSLAEELAGPGVRLLDALDWQGVAMIECKREDDTGRYVVMEVNGRFWARCSSRSMPASTSRRSCFGASPERRSRSAGTTVSASRSRWFWGDVTTCFSDA